MIVMMSTLTAPTTTAVAAALNVAVLTGTTRTAGPPSPILGPRIAKFVTRQLERRGNTVVAMLDPVELQLPLMEKPEFAYARSQVPNNLKQMQQSLSQADAYVCITPEYNHAPSPGLINLLNHFGSSAFSFKPSAIVSYSAGQWGGTRAANALRPILSELGCLPVSAMIHIPNAGQVLNEKGEPSSSINHEEEETETEQKQQQWERYADRCLSQMEWWGNAARHHRQIVNPFDDSPIFEKDPSQRNAP